MVYSIIVTIAFLFVAFFFVLYPVKIKGKKQFVYYLSKINPKAERYLDFYLRKKGQKLSSKWFHNFEVIDSISFPMDFWEEDVLSSRGVDSFYLRDKFSEDVRNLLVSFEGIPCDKDAILKTRLDLERDYFFKPEFSPEARYKIKKTSIEEINSIEIQTESQFDSWVYLPAKAKQPSIFAIDFDFFTNTSIKETLQIDFLMKSLADRFRFMVKDNKILKFDIWSNGYSLGYSDNEWKKFEKPFSMELGKMTHVRLEVCNEIFQISFNGKPEMTIKAKEYERDAAYWSLIFWNGTTEHKDINIRISNFKIFHKRFI